MQSAKDRKGRPTLKQVKPPRGSNTDDTPPPGSFGARLKALEQRRGRPLDDEEQAILGRALNAKDK